MKFFTSLALIGLTSAAEELKFMNDDQILDDNLDLLEIGTGVCVNWSQKQNRFYDLKGFDSDGRDAKTNAPADINFTSSQFVYKACKSAYDFDKTVWSAAGGEADKFVPADFAKTKKSTAYWVTDDKAVYTFQNAEIKTQATTKIDVVAAGDGADNTTPATTGDGDSTNIIEAASNEPVTKGDDDLDTNTNVDSTTTTSSDGDVITTTITTSDDITTNDDTTTTTTDDKLIDHWTLTWTSREDCATDVKTKFTVVLSATCDRSIMAG